MYFATMCLSMLKYKYSGTRLMSDTHTQYEHRTNHLKMQQLTNVYFVSL